MPVTDLGALVGSRADQHLAEEQLHLSAAGQTAAAAVRTLHAEGHLEG